MGTVRTSVVGMWLLLLTAGASHGFDLFPDIQYDSIPGVDPNFHSLDIYTPEDADGTNPIMMMFHGGGHVMGDKNSSPAVARPKADYYTERGWIFVNANYRLTDVSLPYGHPDQVSHPDHATDVANSIGWTKDNIAAYGGNPNHVVIVGFSAGAHLVGLVGTKETLIEGAGYSLDGIDGVIPLDGYYNVPALVPVGHPTLPLIHGPNLESQQDASPVFHVAPDKNIPPMLIVHANATNPIAQSEEFRDTLQANGVPAQSWNAGAKSHSQIGSDLGVVGDVLTQQVDSFLATLSGVEGDFNGDGSLDCHDIDALTLEIVEQSHGPAYDLTNDSFVNQVDLYEWLAIAGAENNASGNAYLLGDANLDGFVDASDYNIWNANKFTRSAAWCSGDFSGDGIVDARDFNIWNAHKFQTANSQLVPEPDSLSLLFVAAISSWLVVRQR